MTYFYAARLLTITFFALLAYIPAHAAVNAQNTRNGIQIITCAADKPFNLSLTTTMINNTWNVGAAGRFPWQQCLEQTVNGSTTSYGWSWSWPNPGNAVYAYPEFLVGKSPWTDGLGNNPTLFPRTITSTKSLVVNYDATVTSNGNYNLAADIWLTKQPHVTGAGNITTELMIWTDYTPDMLISMKSITKIGDTTIDGKDWTAWGARGWGDASGGTSAQWTYIAYVAKKRTTTTSYDARKIMQDAITRGWINPNHYIADVEVGTELVSGSGRANFRSFGVAVQPVSAPPVTPPPKR